jgi:nitrite reductase (NADH) small subunit
MTDLASTSPTRPRPARPAPAAAADPDAGRNWERICRLDQLTPDRGAAALVAGHQVALFLVSATGEVLAVDNRDPISGAQVLSRGIVGDAAGVPKVASPIYKQAFDLRTGQCLDDPAVAVEVHATRVADGWVEVASP